MRHLSVFILFLCCLSSLEGQIISGWSNGSTVNSTNQVTCKIQWNNGLNIGLYFSAALGATDTIYVFFNIDSSKDTTPGSNSYPDAVPIITLPFQADFVAIITTSPAPNVIFQNYSSAWVQDDAVEFYQSVNLTSIELVIYDGRFCTNQSGSDRKLNFISILKNTQWIAPATQGSYFGYLERVMPSYNAYINSFPYVFRVYGGSWNNPSNWLYGNIPYAADARAQNVMMVTSGVFNQPVNIISHLSLSTDTELTLQWPLQVGKGDQVAYLSFENGTSVIGTNDPDTYLHIQTPAQIMAPAGLILPISSLKIEQSLNGNAVTGPSTATIKISNRLTMMDDTAIYTSVMYTDTAVLEFYSSNSSAWRSFFSTEWVSMPASSSINNTVPNQVLINNTHLNINPAPNSEEWKVRGDFTVDSGSLRVNPSAILRVGGTLSVASGAYLSADTCTIYANKFALSGTNFQCTGQNLYVWNSTTNSQQSYPYVPLSLQNGEAVSDSYQTTESFAVLAILDSQWSNTSWYSEPNHTLLGSSSTYNITNSGSYSVTTVHIATKCKSSQYFEVNLGTQTSDMPSDQPPKNNSHAVAIGAAVGGAALLFIAAGVAFLVIRKRRNVSKKNSDSEEEEQQPRKDVGMIPTKPVTPQEKHSSDKRASAKMKSNEIDYTEIKIGKELGRGAFGVVYKAKWRNTDVVVKQMDANKQDEHSMKQFLKETTNVQNARPHPNVCAVFGVCTDPNYPACIVMEYVGGGSLDHLLYFSKINVDAKTAIEFGKNIASGMSHLHHENILHCDLAARNLLVSQQDGKYVLKISDFGLSKVTESDSYNASTTSTFPIRWTPPEALRGGSITRAFDVWSFGVVMWEIIECKKPYPDMSNAEVINQVCDHGYRLPKPQRVPIPDELYQLMQKCWANDPEERPTFNDICEELDRIYERFFGEDELNEKSGSKGNTETVYEKTSTHYETDGTEKPTTQALYGNRT